MVSAFSRQLMMPPP